MRPVPVSLEFRARDVRVSFQGMDRGSLKTLWEEPARQCVHPDMVPPTEPKQKTFLQCNISKLLLRCACIAVLVRESTEHGEALVTSRNCQLLVACHDKQLNRLEVYDRAVRDFERRLMDGEENAADHDFIAPGNFLVTNETGLDPLLGPGDDVFENVAFETEVTVQNEEEDLSDDSGQDASEDVSTVNVKLEDGAASNSAARMSLDEMQKQVFSFETDHLALRANNEYKSVLKLLVLLEAQRMTAVEDLNSLEKEKSAALKNPTEFIKRLQEGSLSLPLRQSVPEVPEVDLAKYSISAKFASATPQQTRATAEPGPSSVEQQSSTPKVAKALPKQPSKPETFNKPWTVEEQRRLEELLVKHPPQVVEAGRWKKIAEELGNRTVKQVASRVQKYFIKLTKAGLQVPGRVPHIPKTNKKVRKVQSTLKTHSYYLSTFFPQHASTVTLDDEPVEEFAIVKKEPEKSEQCSTCLKKIDDSAFRFRCKDCDAIFCADGNCQQDSECVASNHNLKLESRLQVDEDYIIDNHYLDPNYFPSKT